MKEVERKSLIKDIGRAIDILEHKEAKDVHELRELSDHTIKDVALYKNTDAVSLAVLIYSIYKVFYCVQGEKYQKLVRELKNARKHLEQKNFGAYTRSLGRMFSLIKSCNQSVKTHVRDVLYAAKVTKGVTLLDHGLSTKRAAEIMGITEWDILTHVGGTGSSVSHSHRHEKVQANKRLQTAHSLFNFDKNNQNKEKVLFFDAGPLISLAMSRLLFILPALKEKFGGRFLITPAVQQEVIEKPMSIRRFQFEALEIQKLIRDGVLEVHPGISQTKIKAATSLANKSFKVGKKWMEIIQTGEMETLLASQMINDAPVVMDERTMRLLLEDEKSLQQVLERRNKHEVIMDFGAVQRFREQLGKPCILRSVELVALAFELGLLDAYLPSGRNAKRVLLAAVLWNVKYNGSAITEHEITEIEQVILKK